MPIRVSVEQYQAIIEALKQHDGKKRAAALSLGLPENTFKSRLLRAGQLGLAGTKPVIPGFAIKQVSSEIVDGEPSGKEWIQQRPQGEKFELPPGQVLKGVSALTDANDRIINKWWIAREDADKTLEIIHTAVDELKVSLPRIIPTKGPESTAELLLNQYTVTDLHFGMLSWPEETGDGPWDIQIAERLLLAWFSAAIAMAPNAKVGLFAQLGDLMHHDSHEAVTPTHRNILDADSRLQKVIRVVIRVIRQILAMLLEKHAELHVIMAAANHDPASSAWLRELLHAMFESEPRITIDRSPDVYYAYEWGKTALFFHHGHKRKVKQVDDVFAGKFRELYGRAEHAYGHVGHLHSDAVVESNLMRVERHRTLAPPDAYAAGGGWLAKRDAKVITYHREFGEVSRITLSPQMVTERVP